MARIASTTTAGVPTGDPTGGMTLDVLMARAKAAADRQAESMGGGEVIQSPWQGAAQMLRAFTGARQASYAEDQVAAGRQHLTELMSGVAPDGTVDPKVAAQIYALDPDAGQRVMQAAAEAIRAKRLRDETLADRTAGWEHDATVRSDEHTYKSGEEQRIDTRELKQAQDATAAAQTQEATVNDRERLETIDAEKRAETAKIDAEKRAALQPGTTQGKTITEYNNGLYGPVGSPEAIKLRDAALAKENAIPPVPGAVQDRKSLWDQQDAYVNTASSANQLRRAGELLGQGINTGYTAGVQTMYGKVGPGGDKEQANRTDEYNRIMNQEAIAAMSQALKGATTDTEMAEFIKNMNDPTIDPKVKQIQIGNMLAKVDAFQRLQGDRIGELGGRLPEVKPYQPPSDLPEGITEDMIQSTMKLRGMTRDEVMAAYAAKQKGM